jgi:hypothetical protein
LQKIEVEDHDQAEDRYEYGNADGHSPDPTRAFGILYRSLILFVEAFHI